MLEKADNASDAQVAAETVVDWVTSFDDDAEAHIVYDYILIDATDSAPAEYVLGALNGVTVQWSHREAILAETPEGEENVTATIAAEAVHVRPGQTLTRTADGFEVSE